MTQALSTVTIGDTYLLNGEHPKRSNGEQVCAADFSCFKARLNYLVEVEYRPLSKEDYAYISLQSQVPLKVNKLTEINLPTCENDLINRYMQEITTTSGELSELIGTGNKFDTSKEPILAKNLNLLCNLFLLLMDLPVFCQENLELYKASLEKCYEIANKLLTPFLVLIANNGLQDKNTLWGYYSKINSLFNIKETQKMKTLLTSIEEKDYKTTILFLKMYETSNLLVSETLSLLKFLLDKAKNDNQRYDIVQCIFEVYPKNKLDYITEFINNNYGISSDIVRKKPKDVEEYYKVQRDFIPTPIENLTCEGDNSQYIIDLKKGAEELRKKVFQGKQMNKFSLTILEVVANFDNAMQTQNQELDQD